jgi:RimJ/RimL family protein N-acetyltransferase
MKEEIVLETERLYLRKVLPEQDALFFLQLVNSPDWLKYIGDRNVHNEEDALKYLNDRVMKGYGDHGFGAYVLIDKSAGKPIGTAGLYKRPVLDHYDIGFALLPEYYGNGYGFEASAAVMKLAKESGVKQVYGITVGYNERSIHLLTKLGLRFEKTFRMEGDTEELSLYVISLDEQ